MNGTIILGAATTGKNRSIKLLYPRENRTDINAGSLSKKSKKEAVRMLDYWLTGFTMSAKTTLIVIDEFPVRHFGILSEYLLLNFIKLEQQGRDAVYITPKIVVIMDATYDSFYKNMSLLRRYNILTCLGNEDHSINLKLHHPIEIDPAYQN